MPKHEVGFLINYLFEGNKGADVLARIDRRIDRLPGQSDLHLLTRPCRLSHLRRSSPPHRPSNVGIMRPLDIESAAPSSAGTESLPRPTARGVTHEITRTPGHRRAERHSLVSEPIPPELPSTEPRVSQVGSCQCRT